MILRIIGITLIILSFVIGYVIDEPYPPKAFENGKTHMLGLKYMPPCVTLGVDVICRADILLIAFWVLCIIGIGVDIIEPYCP